MKCSIMLIVLVCAIGFWNVCVAELSEAELVKVQEGLKNLEKINVKDLMKKRNVINSYFNCAFDKGPCDALASNFKNMYKSGIVSTELDCNIKTTPKQRAQIIRILKYIHKYYPEQYQESINKFLNGNEPEDIKTFFEDVTL